MRRAALIAAFIYGFAFPFGFVWLVTHHRETAMAAVSWVRDAGWLGVALYAGVYAVGSVLLVPVVVMSAMGGFVFGPVIGLLVASPLNALGATAAFAVGRFLLRRWIEPMIAANPRIAAIDRAIGNQGIRLTLLLRLSPALPHNMLNYAMSTTRLRAREFAIGTWIGALPITAVQVYAGSRATNIGDVVSGRMTLANYVLFAAGIVATAVVIVTLAKTAQRELTRMMDAAEPTSLPRS